MALVPSTVNIVNTTELHFLKNGLNGKFNVCVYVYFAPIYKIRGGKVEKSYGACPNFYLVVRELPTLNRFPGPGRDTNEAVFGFTLPES